MYLQIRTSTLCPFEVCHGLTLVIGLTVIFASYLLQSLVGKKQKEDKVLWIKIITS